MSVVCSWAFVWGQTVPAAKPKDVPKEQSSFLVGKVIDVVTKAPVRKAEVTVLSTEGGGQYSAESGADGVFRVENITPGTYRVAVQRQAYLRQEHGAKRQGGVGRIIALDADRDPPELSIQLVPASAITGRVVDDDGDPVQNVRVQSLRMGFSRGKPSLVSAGNPQMGSITDDRGEFRISGIAPGRYVVSADYHHTDPPPQASAETGGTRKPKARLRRFVLTYYPSAPDAAVASAIEILPGVNAEGLNIGLLKLPAYSVRGRVNVPEKIGAQPGLRVALQRRGSAFGFDLVSGLSAFVGKNGGFEFTAVPPGRYYLAVLSLIRLAPRVLMRQELDVTNDDLQDLVIDAPAPFQLHGRITVEGDPQARCAGVRVMLSTTEAPSINPPNAESGSKCEFTLEDVGADVYSVSVSGGPSNAYLKALRLGDDVLPDTRVDFRHSGASPLEVILGSPGGSVSGSLRNGDEAGRDGNAAVVLIPDPAGPDAAGLYRVATADADGRFHFDGVKPGSYRIYAWDNIETGAWFDPEVIAKHRGGSEALRIEEKSQVRIEVKAIR